MDAIMAARELVKIQKRISKVQAVLAELNEQRAVLLRMLGGPDGT